MSFRDKFVNLYKGRSYGAQAIATYDAVYSEFMKIPCSCCGAQRKFVHDKIMKAAMATCRVEGDYHPENFFKPIEEFASGQAYDITVNPTLARNLGNLNPGDGPKYKGRGLTMTTGYNNYKRLGLQDEPKKVLDLQTSAWALAVYFTDNGTDILATAAKTDADWTDVRRSVNGGTNGLAPFLKIINDYNNL